MEIKNNQLTINIPEGMEIDTENSSLAEGIIKFKSKYITYSKIINSFNSITNPIAYIHSSAIKPNGLQHSVQQLPADAAAVMARLHTLADATRTALADWQAAGGAAG